MVRHHHSIGNEATSTGLLGAGTVAAWFLLLDFIAGRPLHIASVLGQVLLFGSRKPELGALHWGGVDRSPRAARPATWGRQDHCTWRSRGPP
jgi:hypothetical protein